MKRIAHKLDDVERMETQLLPFHKSNKNLCNKYELTAVKFFDYEADIETQMRNLQDSKQKESFHPLSLALYNPDYYNTVDALQHTFTVCQFDHIIEIDIKSILGDELYGLEYKFSLYLLQYMPSLEVLKIWSIHVNDRRIPTLVLNRLKSLDIFCFHIIRNWKTSSKYLQNILQASSLLETLNTALKIEYRDSQYRFMFDLIDNKHLKSVCLENDPKRTEKYWKTLTTSIKKP